MPSLKPPNTLKSLLWLITPEQRHYIVIITHLNTCESSQPSYLSQLSTLLYPLLFYPITSLSFHHFLTKIWKLFLSHSCSALWKKLLPKSHLLLSVHRSFTQNEKYCYFISCYFIFRLPPSPL